MELQRVGSWNAAVQCRSTWGRFPFWLIFFRWIETTNQSIFEIFSFSFVFLVFMFFFIVFFVLHCSFDRMSTKTGNVIF